MFITHVNFVVFLTNTKTLKLLPEISFIRSHSFMLKEEGGGVHMQAHEQSFSHGLFIYVNHDHEFTDSFFEKKNIHKTFFCVSQYRTLVMHHMCILVNSVLDPLARQEHCSGSFIW